MDDIILVAPFDGFNQLKHIVSKPKKKTKAIKETHTLGAQEGRGGVDVALVSLERDLCHV